ncbi:hypothetical protein HDE_13629 [Halotydeus destructor]|nr:hypothetical protein HDE_13629 [Halotydeus destructor]
MLTTFSSAVLCLIVLTTVSSEPVKYTVAKTSNFKNIQFFWFGPTVEETFPEAQRLCSLYGGQLAEPQHGIMHGLQVEFGDHYWVNGYYDQETSTWRWVSDDLPIDDMHWDKNEERCKDAECVHWRPFITERAAYLVMSAVDERTGPKLPFICDKPLV